MNLDYNRCGYICFTRIQLLVINMSTFLVTGAAGYIAGRIMEFLSEWEGCGRLVGVDQKPRPDRFPGDSYHRIDIRSRDATLAIERESPDSIIHLAYAVDFLHDTEMESSVNIGGLTRVLQGAAESGCNHLLVASSTSVYGAYPGIALFQDEEGPVHANQDLPYARDKVTVERMCRDFSALNPDVKVTVIRPAIVVGPNWGNFWTAIFFALPFVLRIAGCDTCFQFIHENDLVQLWRLCIEQEAPGIFNATASGAVSTDEIAGMLGKRTFPMHRSFAVLAMRLVHRLRLLPVGTPPGAVDFLCYPWIASNDKARSVLGFDPAYDSREAFTLMAGMQDRLLENLLRSTPEGYRFFRSVVRASTASRSRR